MKRAWALTLISCVTAVVALAQEQGPASTDGSPPPPDTMATSPASAPAPSPPPDTTAPGSESSPAPSETPVNVPPDRQAAPAPDPASETGAQGAREVPLDIESFDARVRRRMDEFSQRHQQREREMASYDRASGADPSLGRLPIRVRRKWNSATNSIANRPARSWQVTTLNGPTMSKARSRCFRTSSPGGARR